MNIYDPADSLRYVHLSGPAEARSAQPAGPIPAGPIPASPIPATPIPARLATASPLPSGYANQSPLTRLQRRPAPARRDGVGVLVRLA